jgi:cell division protease FtsH
MDGFADSGVVVVAATNRPDVLDNALLRPGRFDRRVVVGLPDKKGRIGLFRMYLEKAVCEEGLDIEKLSESLGRRSVGMSGADVRAVINEAALGAAKINGSGISERGANDALERVALGRERRSVELSVKAQRITAWHESGHALCALLTVGANTPERVSIVPRGTTGGATWFAEADEEHFITRTQAKASMVVAFGGRAAEELLLDGDFTQGAAGDIAQATSVAERMVCEWGMSDLGLVRIDRDRPFEMSDRAREEVRKLVSEAFEKARSIVKRERVTLEQIADLLLEQETVSRDELALLVGHRSDLEKP